MSERGPAAERSRSAGRDSANEKLLDRLADAIRRLVPPRLPDKSGAALRPAPSLPDPTAKGPKPAKRRR